jgi:hypothetical protein
MHQSFFIKHLDTDFQIDVELQIAAEDNKSLLKKFSLVKPFFSLLKDLYQFYLTLLGLDLFLTQKYVSYTITIQINNLIICYIVLKN